ncbi:hypothetical protein RND71_032083 [Anisodus tanguticus]|uniref:Uncharacterized protein n=1 Tax=Anisodus tanguticus TaxID=243964 RepID=A0AAE1UY24_9SOLA|nr:hypothetical protein RND71_032083 [Anisodus tanguticus]
MYKIQMLQCQQSQLDILSVFDEVPLTSHARRLLGEDKIELSKDKDVCTEDKIAAAEEEGDEGMSHAHDDPYLSIPHVKIWLKCQFKWSVKMRVEHRGWYDPSMYDRDVRWSFKCSRDSTNVMPQPPFHSHIVEEYTQGLDDLGECPIYTNYIEIDNEEVECRAGISITYSMRSAATAAIHTCLGEIAFTIGQNFMNKKGCDKYWKSLVLKEPSLDKL